MRRWLSDATAILLSMHPTIPMKARDIFANMVDLGWPGNFGHARKAMNVVSKTLIYQPQKKYWALTAAGLAQRNSVVEEMKFALSRVSFRAAPPPPPPTQPAESDMYKPNGEGHPVCHGCGVSVGHPHMPSCRSPMVAAMEGLDADVTAR